METDHTRRRPARRTPDSRKGRRMIRHVAMFKFRPQVTPEQRRAARDALASNKDHCPTISAYTVGLDLDRNPRNWDMVLVGDFEDTEALEAYFTHPHHDEVSDRIEELTYADRTARVQFEY
jgi:quinol monooxygenase YgiN